MLAMLVFAPPWADLGMPLWGVADASSAYLLKPQPLSGLEEILSELKSLLRPDSAGH